MAITVLPQKTGIGSALGSALGTGLGSGLEMLAQQRMENLMQAQQQRQTATGLEALGFSPEQAQQLSNLPSAPLQELIKAKTKEPSQQAFAQSLSAILGGGEPQQGAFGEAAQTMNEPLTSPGEPTPGEQAPALLNERQALELAKLRLKKEAAQESKKQAAFKETKEERKQILNDYKAARQDYDDLSRIEELSQSNQLSGPGYSEFLKRSGLDVPALMNPASEEFQKITQNFMRNAKQYLGSRISNYELEQFLKTIPSLSQSPEGRQRVIANLKKVARAKKEYYNAYKKVMQKNKNIPPFDLAEQVEEQVDKQMDKLAQQFRKDLEKPVPEGESALRTWAGSLGGSIVGAGGQALSGIGKVAGLAKGVSAFL